MFFYIAYSRTEQNMGSAPNNLQNVAFCQCNHLLILLLQAETEIRFLRLKLSNICHLPTPIRSPFLLHLKSFRIRGAFLLLTVPKYHYFTLFFDAGLKHNGNTVHCTFSFLFYQCMSILNRAVLMLIFALKAKNTFALS
jgi:hypothetical protein